MMDRRRFLHLGAAGLSLPAWFALPRSASAAPRADGFGRAKSCIVMFAWGGMSHLDTLDLKPEAPIDIRGPFQPRGTEVPGLRISEHLPGLAKQAPRMAVVRSVHHEAPGHRPAAYWVLTGHAPPFPTSNWEATRKDWPCLGAQVSLAKEGGPGALPGNVMLPYPMADGGPANGQHAGFLGLSHDPLVFRPPAGDPFDGKSPDVGTIALETLSAEERRRHDGRRDLLRTLEACRAAIPEAAANVAWRERAFDLLLDDAAVRAFDLDAEPRSVREAYGRHICGQSALLARKLSEAGVPLTTVICAAGDLNGSVGAHWDTHADNFGRLKNQMLPPLDQAFSALLDDLSTRGRLDETLVVLLTEFGRTPKIAQGHGRDHYPGCFSVAFAGGGIRGGRVYGASDPMGAQPVENPCGPADLQATIFHALGIEPDFTVHDAEGRPMHACDGRPLPLF